MGGHGGLNILPQKRWNVYGRENRLKVARDEAKHASEQQELQEKHRAAEAQARRQLLLHRAKERRAAALGNTANLLTNDDVSDDEQQQLPLAGTGNQHNQHNTAVQQEQHLPQRSRHQYDDNDAEQQLQLQPQQPHSQLQQVAESQEEPVLEHINFWKELETKAEHPDRQKEKRDEKKKRGNPDTYTTDARFDESFQLGYGLSGPKPWYARAVQPDTDDMQQQQPQGLHAIGEQQQSREKLLQLTTAPPALDSNRQQKKRRHDSSDSPSSDSNSSSGSDNSSSSASSTERKRRNRKLHGKSKQKASSRSSKETKHKRLKHKKNKKHKRKEKKAGGAAAVSAAAEKALALAQLRADRLEREAAERHRSMVATGQRVPIAKRYNSSYGYADALKQGAHAGAEVAAKGAAATAVNSLRHRFGR